MQRISGDSIGSKGARRDGEGGKLRWKSNADIRTHYDSMTKDKDINMRAYESWDYRYRGTGVRG
jgi:hypothetical protein